MISENTALLLAHLHRERDGAKKLIAECEEQKDRNNDIWTRSYGESLERPNLNKGRYIEVRIPSGGSDSNAYCPRMVAPVLGLAILRAHLAEVEAKIIATNEVARIELSTPPAAVQE